MYLRKATKTWCRIYCLFLWLLAVLRWYGTQCFLFFVFYNKKNSIICWQKRKSVTCYHTNAEIKLIYVNECKRKLGNENDLFTRSNSNDISGIIGKKNCMYCVVGLFNFRFKQLKKVFFFELITATIIIISFSVYQFPIDVNKF